MAATPFVHADIAVLQSRSAADYQPNLTVLANKEYDEIFAVGFLMARDVDEVASRFPTRNFAIIDAIVDDWLRDQLDAAASLAPPP